MGENVLLIDDEESVLKSVGAYFERLGAEVYRAASGEEGIATFERVRPDLLITDLHLPGISGLDVLERLVPQGASVILMTGQGDIETAVRAMQLGAEHFLTKPINLTHLGAAAARVWEKVRLRRENSRLRSRERGAGGLETLGESPAMREVERQIQLLAQSERTTVLLGGESGTGKGWVARRVHDFSPRSGGPFVEVNCAGLSATFLDSELFGHEKGAYTDAKERKQGLFELADGGTLFLDEIGDLALELQPKLLKVLETKTFRRLGGTKEITVDVRLIAATHRDLVAAVKQNAFREDLYYRLSVMPLQLPALRERTREDRLVLLTRLLGDLQQQLPGSPAEWSGEALDRLLSAPWPGNVREMRNVLERGLILARGQPQLGVEHLPLDLRRTAAGGNSQGGDKYQATTLEDVERRHIERALRFHNGNRTRAAQDLGISRATLINKIKAYALDL
jgi:DNA-binding NtrC family response regulator